MIKIMSENPSRPPLPASRNGPATPEDVWYTPTQQSSDRVPPHPIKYEELNQPQSGGQKTLPSDKVPDRKTPDLNYHDQLLELAQAQLHGGHHTVPNYVRFDDSQASGFSQPTSYVSEVQYSYPHYNEAQVRFLGSGVAESPLEVSQVPRSQSYGVGSHMYYPETPAQFEGSVAPPPRMEPQQVSYLGNSESTAAMQESQLKLHLSNLQFDPPVFHRGLQQSHYADSELSLMPYTGSLSQSLYTGLGSHTYAQPPMVNQHGISPLLDQQTWVNSYSNSSQFYQPGVTHGISQSTSAQGQGNVWESLAAPTEWSAKNPGLSSSQFNDLPMSQSQYYGPCQPPQRPLVEANQTTLNPPVMPVLTSNYSTLHQKPVYTGSQKDSMSNAYSSLSNEKSAKDLRQAVLNHLRRSMRLKSSHSSGGALLREEIHTGNDLWHKSQGQMEQLKDTGPQESVATHSSMRSRRDSGVSISSRDAADSISVASSADGHRDETVAPSRLVVTFKDIHKGLGDGAVSTLAEPPSSPCGHTLLNISQMLINQEKTTRLEQHIRDQNVSIGKSPDSAAGKVVDSSDSAGTDIQETATQPSEFPQEKFREGQDTGGVPNVPPGSSEGLSPPAAASLSEVISNAYESLKMSVDELVLRGHMSMDRSKHDPEEACPCQPVLHGDELKPVNVGPADDEQSKPGVLQMPAGTCPKSNLTGSDMMCDSGCQDLFVATPETLHSQKSWALPGSFVNNESPESIFVTQDFSRQAEVEKQQYQPSGTLPEIMQQCDSPSFAGHLNQRSEVVVLEQAALRMPDIIDKDPKPWSPAVPVNSDSGPLPLRCRTLSSSSSTKTNMSNYCSTTGSAAEENFVVGDLERSTDLPLIGSRVSPDTEITNAEYNMYKPISGFQTTLEVDSDSNINDNLSDISRCTTPLCPSWRSSHTPSEESWAQSKKMNGGVSEAADKPTEALELDRFGDLNRRSLTQEDTRGQMLWPASGRTGSDGSNMSEGSSPVIHFPLAVSTPRTTPTTTIAPAGGTIPYSLQPSPVSWWQETPVSTIANPAAPMPVLFLSSSPNLMGLSQTGISQHPTPLPSFNSTYVHPGFSGRPNIVDPAGSRNVSMIPSVWSGLTTSPSVNSYNPLPTSTWKTSNCPVDVLDRSKTKRNSLLLFQPPPETLELMGQPRVYAVPPVQPRTVPSSTSRAQPYIGQPSTSQAQSYVGQPSTSRAQPYVGRPSTCQTQPYVGPPSTSQAQVYIGSPGKKGPFCPELDGSAALSSLLGVTPEKFLTPGTNPECSKSAAVSPACATAPTWKQGPVPRKIGKGGFRPRHYPITSIQIGLFKHVVAKDSGKKAATLKVLFGKRKLVYEYVEAPGLSGSTPQSDRHTYVIEVPFTSVVGLRGAGNELWLEVCRTPQMYHIFSQVKTPGGTAGTRPKPSYRHPEDLTNGQLTTAQYHKIEFVLPKANQLTELMGKFDERFQAMFECSLVPMDQYAVDKGPDLTVDLSSDSQHLKQHGCSGKTAMSTCAVQSAATCTTPPLISTCTAQSVASTCTARPTATCTAWPLMSRYTVQSVMSTSTVQPVMSTCIAQPATSARSAWPATSTSTTQPASSTCTARPVTSTCPVRPETPICTAQSTATCTPKSSEVLHHLIKKRMLVSSQTKAELVNQEVLYKAQPEQKGTGCSCIQVCKPKWCLCSRTVEKCGEGRCECSCIRSLKGGVECDRRKGRRKRVAEWSRSEDIIECSRHAAIPTARAVLLDSLKQTCGTRSSANEGSSQHTTVIQTSANEGSSQHTAAVQTSANEASSQHTTVVQTSANEGSSQHTTVIQTSANEGSSQHTAAVQTSANEASSQHTTVVQTSANEGSSQHTAAVQTSANEASSQHTTVVQTSANEGSSQHTAAVQTSANEASSQHTTVVQTSANEGSSQHTAAIQTSANEASSQHTTVVQTSANEGSSQHTAVVQTSANEGSSQYTAVVQTSANEGSSQHTAVVQTSANEGSSQYTAVVQTSANEGSSQHMAVVQISTNEGSSQHAAVVQTSANEGSSQHIEVVQTSANEGSSQYTEIVEISANEGSSQHTAVQTTANEGPSQHVAVQTSANEGPKQQIAVVQTAANENLSQDTRVVQTSENKELSQHTEPSHSQSPVINKGPSQTTELSQSQSPLVNKGPSQHTTVVHISANDGTAQSTAVLQTSDEGPSQHTEPSCSQSPVTNDESSQHTEIAHPYSPTGNKGPSQHIEVSHPQNPFDNEVPPPKSVSTFEGFSQHPYLSPLSPKTIVSQPGNPHNHSTLMISQGSSQNGSTPHQSPVAVSGCLPTECPPCLSPIRMGPAPCASGVMNQQLSGTSHPERTVATDTGLSQSTLPTDTGLSEQTLPPDTGLFKRTVPTDTGLSERTLPTDTFLSERTLTTWTDLSERIMLADTGLSESTTATDTVPSAHNGLAQCHCDATLKKLLESSGSPPPASSDRDQGVEHKGDKVLTVSLGQAGLTEWPGGLPTSGSTVCPEMSRPPPVTSVFTSITESFSALIRPHGNWSPSHLIKPPGNPSPSNLVRSRPAEWDQAEENHPTPSKRKKRNNGKNCGCIKGCKAQRCRCVHAERVCTSRCNCYETGMCTKIIDVFQRAGVKAEDIQANRCLSDNVAKEGHMRALIEKWVSLPCCNVEVRSINLAAPFSCPTCYRDCVFSWCTGVFQKGERKHCNLCHACKDADHHHILLDDTDQESVYPESSTKETSIPVPEIKGRKTSQRVKQRSVRLPKVEDYDHWPEFPVAHVSLCRKLSMTQVVGKDVTDAVKKIVEESKNDPAGGPSLVVHCPKKRGPRVLQRKQCTKKAVEELIHDLEGKGCVKQHQGKHNVVGQKFIGSVEKFGPGDSQVSTVHLPSSGKMSLPDSSQEQRSSRTCRNLGVKCGISKISGSLPSPQAAGGSHSPNSQIRAGTRRSKRCTLLTQDEPGSLQLDSATSCIMCVKPGALSGETKQQQPPVSRFGMCTRSRSRSQSDRSSVLEVPVVRSNVSCGSAAQNLSDLQSTPENIGEVAHTFLPANSYTSPFPPVPGYLDFPDAHGPLPVFSNACEMPPCRVGLDLEHLIEYAEQLSSNSEKSDVFGRPLAVSSPKPLDH